MPKTNMYNMNFDFSITKTPDEEELFEITLSRRLVEALPLS